MSWQNLRGYLGIAGLIGVFTAQLVLAEQGHSLPIKKIWVDEEKQVVVEFNNTNGSFPTVPHVLDLPGPNHRVVLDFTDSMLDKAALPSADVLTQLISQNLPFVKSIRYSNLPNSAKPTARIVLDLPEDMKVRPRVVKLEEHAVTINLGDDKKIASVPNSGVVSEKIFEQPQEVASNTESQAETGAANPDNVTQSVISQQTQASPGQAWDWSNGGQATTTPTAQPEPSQAVLATSANKEQAEMPSAPEGLGPDGQSLAVSPVGNSAGQQEPTAVQPATQTETQQEPTAVQPATQTETQQEPTPVQPAAQTESQQEPTAVQPAASTETQQEPTAVQPAAQTESQQEPTAVQPAAQTETQQEPMAVQPATSTESQQEPMAVQPATQTESQQESMAGQVVSQQQASGTATASGAGSEENLLKDELKPLTTGSTTESTNQEAPATQPTENAGPAANEPSNGREKTASVASEESKTNNLEAIKRYNSAVQHHLSGRLAEAVVDYQAALEANPNLSEAHSNLGLIYNQQHNYAQALAEFRKALAINPRDAITYNGIGAALRAQKDLLGAVKNWQTAVSLDPHLATAHYNLGTAYEIQKDYERAVDSYRQAVKNDYRLGEAYYRIGLIMERRHRNDEAAEEFGQALKVSSTSEYSEDARQRLAFLTQNKKSAKR